MNNREKMMSLSWKNMRFVDSYQFMAEPLGCLANNIPVD